MKLAGAVSQGTIVSAHLGSTRYSYKTGFGKCGHRGPKYSVHGQRDPVLS